MSIKQSNTLCKQSLFCKLYNRRGSYTGPYIASSNFLYYSMLPSIVGFGLSAGQWFLNYKRCYVINSTQCNFDIEVNSALTEQRTVLLSFNVLWLKPLKIIINYFRPPKIKLKKYPNTYKTYYYSFKIFPRFWLAKSTRLIHHNQLLTTKFGRILTLTRKWRQKCSIFAG